MLDLKIHVYFKQYLAYRKYFNYYQLLRKVAMGTFQKFFARQASNLMFN